MSPFSKRIAYAISLLLVLPAIAVVAAPPHPTGPVISTPIISPSSPGPNDQVTILVNVTASAGIHNVTVIFTIDNWKTSNKTIVASYNSTNQHAVAHIPPLYNGGRVEFYITAYDNNNNRAINNNNGGYFSYTVAAPTSIFNTSTWVETAIVLIAVGAAASVAVYSLRSRTSTGSRRN